MMDKPIAILGCGPSGLLAAHAASTVSKLPIALFSDRPEPSRLGGAQFLHKPIPGLTPSLPDARIRYVVRGTAEGYARKIYGGVKPPFVSFDPSKDGTFQDAWNLIKTYEKLWEAFGHHVNDQLIDDEWIKGMEEDFSMIISSIPKFAICANPIHVFTNSEIHIYNGLVEEFPDNTIVYDGTEERSWGRSSLLFGNPGTEWGSEVKMPFPDKAIARKPLMTTCDCHPEIVKVGRFGTWRKGVLVNDAYQTTIEAIQERGL